MGVVVSCIIFKQTIILALFSVAFRRHKLTSKNKLNQNEGCPIHPICNGSPKWWRSVTGRDGSILFVSLRHVGGPSRSGRMVMTVDSLSVRKRPRKHSWRRYGVGYGVRWKCQRIVPIGTDRDDPSQP